MSPVLPATFPAGKGDAAECDPAVSSDSAEQLHRVIYVSWAAKFFSQFRALFYKNVLVSARNYRATIMRLLAPLFFMFLLFLINIAVRKSLPQIDYLIDLPNPDITPVTAIPACGEDPYVLLPCYDFLYSPVGDPAAERIVAGMRANNPGRPIPASAVLGLASIEAANTWFLAHAGQGGGAVHFSPVPGGGAGLDFVLQVNSTGQLWRGINRDPTFYVQVPLQVAAEREIAREVLATSPAGVANPALAADLAWDQTTSLFAHPQTSDLNVVGQGIGPFVFAANMFNFVLLLSAVALEKELGLRQALKTMGMLDSAFWASWIGSELVIAILFTCLLIAFGAAFGFAFFTVNSFGIIFFLFFLFQAAMIAVSITLSALLSRASSAVIMGFLIFVIGWICQAVVAFGFPYTPDNITKVPALNYIFALLPWCMLAKASVDLGLASTATGTQGIGWGARTSYCMNVPTPEGQDALYNPDIYQNFECVWPINSLLWILTGQAVGYLLLGIWLDNVLPNRAGIRRPVYYFLQPSYWSSHRSAHQGIRPPAAGPGDAAGALDEDVAAEEERLRAAVPHRTGAAGALSASSGAVVEVFGLSRVFDTRPWWRRLRRRTPGTAAAAANANPARVSPAPSSAAAPSAPPPPPPRRAWYDPRGWRRTPAAPAGVTDAAEAARRARADQGTFWAVRGSWFAIERDTCFCLLGPNGAGKSTTIHCLTGVLPLSGGDALIAGESLSSAGGMDRVRAVMGVCPQFDVLWGELSGREHMLLYGAVKGLPRACVTRQADELLGRVKLTKAAGVLSAAYSGGMRRRLSVALALLGDPLVLYLDEPTTGMDPISRRHVWDVVEEAKRGRAVVLTTHSMEEADILGDAVGIMARGRLRALGTPLHLKQRFGSGYQLSVSVGGEQDDLPGADASPATAAAVERLTAFFGEELGLEPHSLTGSYLHFHIPQDRQAQLPAFLERLDARRSELRISDLQVALTSLEEVFLSIARRAEMEAAALEGRCLVRFVAPDGTALDVALGEDSVTAPDGSRYAVVWTQDESGTLQILRVERQGEALGPVGGAVELVGRD